MIDPKDIYQKLTQSGNAWAEAQYAADILDDATRPLLAKLSAESREKSQNAREAYALAHPAYAEHLKLRAETKKAAAKAKVEYHARQSWFEAMRTQAATERHANKYST
jgi:hypothetical protein